MILVYIMCDNGPTVMAGFVLKNEAIEYAALHPGYKVLDTPPSAFVMLNNAANLAAAHHVRVD